MAAHSFQCINPAELGKPLGPYSQALVIPAASQWLQLSGQTPLRADGSVPEGFEAQAERVWHRMSV